MQVPNPIPATQHQTEGSERNSGTPNSIPPEQHQLEEFEENHGIPGPTPPAQHVSILLLGATGAGKSTFIATTSGHDVQIGHGLTSCTVNCASYDFEVAGIRITLIDTPGFDDTTRDDMDILTTISSYMNNSRVPPIFGIIYLHRITDKRLTGTARLNLEIVKTMCGQHFYSHVVLSTTMWGNIQSNDVHLECKERARQLLESPSYWGDMSSTGASYIPFGGSKESGMDIIRHLLSRPPAQPTDLQQELQNGMEMQDTKAGSVIIAERKRREDRRKKELEEDLAEMEEERAKLIAERNRLAPNGRANGQTKRVKGNSRSMEFFAPSTSNTKRKKASPMQDDGIDAENSEGKNSVSHTLAKMVGNGLRWLAS